MAYELDFFKRSFTVLLYLFNTLQIWWHAGNNGMWNLQHVAKFR